MLRKIAGEHAIGVRLDGDRERVRVSIERLLQRREDGQGAHYQLQGYTSRSYASYAYVAAIRDGEAVLCFPDWHPRRPVGLFLNLVPPEVRVPGAWLSLKCDLGATSGARLQPNTMVPCEDPGPERIERPDLG